MNTHTHTLQWTLQSASVVLGLRSLVSKVQYQSFSQWRAAESMRSRMGEEPGPGPESLTRRGVEELRRCSLGLRVWMMSQIGYEEASWAKLNERGTKKIGRQIPVTTTTTTTGCLLHSFIEHSIFCVQKKHAEVCYFRKTRSCFTSDCINVWSTCAESFTVFQLAKKGKKYVRRRKY